MAGAAHALLNLLELGEQKREPPAWRDDESERDDPEGEIQQQHHLFFLPCVRIQLFFCFLSLGTNIQLPEASPPLLAHY